MTQQMSRRQFLKLSAGAMGGVAASEMAGLGFDATRVHARTHARQIKQGKEVPSVCPYCAVGCGQIVTVADGKILDIQGSYDSPINVGTLCTKGPLEALVTFQQFLVLADPEGQVDMTAEAISRRTTIPLGVIVVALAVAWQAGRGIPAEPTTATALLVQTNLPQQDVFDPLWVHNNPDEMQALEQLTRQAVAAQPSPPALVIWPEIPVSIYFNHDPVMRARLIALAQSTRAYFITGTIDYQPAGGERPDVFNSAVLLSPAGELVAQYDKMELVPFGEYLPAVGRLGFFQRMVREVSDFKPGRDYDVMPTAHGRLSIFICYEAIFPGQVRQFVAREGGAEVLVNISNDGWFGRSAAAAQHLNMARLRAVETRRFLLRSTNTGISAVIDPYGRIVARAPDHVRAALPVSFAPRQERSFYSRHGDWLPFICTLAVVAALGREFWAEALEEAIRQ